MEACVQPSSPLYRAAWRWHLYAGLIVLPVLLWLAATGALYLYKPEIERFVYRDWSKVAVSGEVQPVSRLITAVERQSGATVKQVMRPAAPDEGWRMALAMPDGGRRLAFVDPYRAILLGSASGGGIMATVRDLHSLAITGPVGNALVEIVAGWAIVLVVTGLILWWPRSGSPVVGVRGKPKGRLFWRDLHASTGLVAAAIILFLAATGMPWTVFAGAKLNTWVAANGLGRPERPGPKAASAHDEHEGHGAKESLPWSMQSASPPVARESVQRITPDLAIARAEWSGLSAPWTLTLPGKPGAPYLVSRAIVRADDAHAVYIDAGTGQVLQDARYAQFGGGARAIEWGIATHQGQQYGGPNRLLMLFGCVAIWALGITGPVLWWKRRRAGRLREPPRTDPRRERGLAAAMLLLAVALPLTGLTMLAALIGEAGSRIFTARERHS
ncbi:PepSY domain-containing protein [Sphingomonas sp. G-3-2-10]|nr:PepSY domain-containing protein [Sphingomonas sp. G-3-2-10]